MAVMIGVDPHKRSHTAVAVDADEVELGRLEVRASRVQVDELLAWAARFGEQVWAIESADGLGYLLGQQLVAAGERVVDVPATLSARVRVLASGRSNKNDPNDGYSVAVAAHARARTARRGARPIMRPCCACWRSATSSWAVPAPHRPAGCMRCWPSSFRAESRKEITAESRPGAPRQRRPGGSGRRDSSPAGAWSISRTCAASTSQLRDLHQRMDEAVKASGTTVTELFGFGPVGAAIADRLHP